MSDDQTSFLGGNVRLWHDIDLKHQPMESSVSNAAVVW